MACIAITITANACTGIKQPLRNLAKTDIDIISDIHIQMLRTHMQELALTLYDNNADHLAKAPYLSLENRMVQILDHPTDVAYREISYKQSTEAIELAFNPHHGGDRVFVLLLGISSMLRLSYNNLEELFLLDELDPQMLYDSARNLEAIAQRLHSETFLGRTSINLGSASERQSVENRLASMVSIQDMMAKIIASKTKRMIKTAVHSATTILIPIGL